MAPRSLFDSAVTCSAGASSGYVVRRPTHRRANDRCAKWANDPTACDLFRTPIYPFHGRKLCRFCALFLLPALLIVSGCQSEKPNAASSPVPVGKGETGRPLDLAIAGEGYFIVEVSDGAYLFTRRGSLVVSSTGELVNEDGYRIFPHVTVEAVAAKLSIAADGGIHLAVGDGPDERVGQVLLARFEHDAALDRDGIYRVPTAGSGLPTTGRPGTKGLGTIVTGRLE